MSGVRRHKENPRSRPAPSSPEEIATVGIERLAAGGDGIARVDGRVCFVPRSAPGDRAQVAYRTSARLARGRVLQLLEPSPHRVEPRCRHYVADRCGGCQLQHVDSVTQREARVAIVTDALRRIGGRTVERPSLETGDEWEYRGRLTLTLLRRGARWIGGLHPYDDAGRVFALEECPISHPALVAAWRGARTALHGLPEAPALRLGLRLVSETATGDVGEPVVLVVQGGTSWNTRAEWTEAVRRAAPGVQSVHWEPAADRGAPGGNRAPVVDGHVDDLAPDAAEALAFAQVNREVAGLLRAHVLEAVTELAPSHVIDAYAGSGVLSAMLAGRGIGVTAIESDPAATSRARVRATEEPSGAPIEVITARVEQGLPGVLPADVVVLNPPRRGLDASVTAVLERSRDVRALVYVSCDPATLARDLARLPSWRIASVRCFDMFPQTAHVETVVVLLREDA